MQNFYDFYKNHKNRKNRDFCEISRFLRFFANFEKNADQALGASAFKRLLHRVLRIKKNSLRTGKNTRQRERRTDQKNDTKIKNFLSRLVLRFSPFQKNFQFFFVFLQKKLLSVTAESRKIFDIAKFFSLFRDVMKFLIDQKILIDVKKFFLRAKNFFLTKKIFFARKKIFYIVL